MRGGLFVEFVGPSCRGAAALRPHEAVSRVSGAAALLPHEAVSRSPSVSFDRFSQTARPVQQIHHAKRAKCK
eukprot:scaffold14364_cov67-Skeletonema_dohrnii-CCMP3373.AAC.1